MLGRTERGEDLAGHVGCMEGSLLLELGPRAPHSVIMANPP